MIDLQKFCGREHERAYLQKPWSRGEWTYATNGKLMVRIPRRPDVPAADEQNPAAEKAEQLFVESNPWECSPAPKIKLPEPSDDECEECDGRGTAHDCPTCQCPCSFCIGGQRRPYHGVYVSIGEVDFKADDIALIVDLPALYLSNSLSREHPMAFRFNGGEGLLMPMKVDMDGSVKVAWPPKENQ